MVCHRRGHKPKRIIRAFRILAYKVVVLINNFKTEFVEDNSVVRWMVGELTKSMHADRKIIIIKDINELPLADIIIEILGCSSFRRYFITTRGGYGETFAMW
jgi:hypothetical protein